ncbi:MAG: bifunctional 5,10-methylenetetrahydrofolate dehydrogenase/5,10-methenyltetrahydrofolate cyclohydrolase [Patescibacteria group bacterium]
MAQILDGRIPRDQIILRLKKRVQLLNPKPALAIVQVGNRAESNAYIKQKKIFAEKIGVVVKHLQLAPNISEGSLLEKIKKLNKDSSVHGIVVQLPISEHLNELDIIKAINPQKDVDGLTPGSKFVPATAKGILSLLDFYEFKLKGARAVVVGRSMLVGKPTALALLNRDVTVTVAHKQTKNLKEVTKTADILVVAIGDPKFIDSKYVKKGQVVVDVGINTKKLSLKEEIATGKSQVLVGDVNFEKVKGIVRAISPVPGGVGAMTVASLFENLVEAYKLQN